VYEAAVDRQLRAPHVSGGFMRAKGLWAWIVAAAAVGVMVVPATAQNEKLRIDAFAVSMSNIATGANAQVEITIDRWTTPAEREKLITVMIEKGSDTLLRELQKMPSHGRFRVPNWRGPDPHKLALGNDLRYAWQTTAADGGRRIVIVTDRYIGFEEARAQPRTIDYPFSLFEIRVDKSGKGEGKVALATMINFDKKRNVLELENYSSEPVRLNNLTMKVEK
jgi:hypothetical protein